MSCHYGAPLRRSLRLRKCPKLSHGVEESDTFSKLDDDIIIFHILPRLSLQEAVRTSVLSRRWLTLWPPSIGPRLIFLFSSFTKLYGKLTYIRRFTPLLIRGVNNVLKAYSNPTLDELTICFDFDSGSSQIIDSWIQYAFRKGVTRLQLDFGSYYLGSTDCCYPFPSIHKLSAYHPANCTGMYNLRDVCLKSIKVSSEVVEFMLSHCPFLERLSVWRSSCVEDLRVSPQSSKFKSLEIVDCFYLEIKISAPYLVSLTFVGDEEDFYLEYVPLLTELSIGCDYCRCFLENTSLHFGYISQLKKLTLDLDCEVVSASINFPLEFSELVNLEQLEVKLKAKKDSCLLWLIILIKAAPFLNRFFVELCTRQTGNENHRELQQDKYQRRLRKLGNAIKQVHHQFLKLIEIKGFRGKPSEVEFAKRLLGISGSLEQFVVEPLNVIKMNRVWHQSIKKYRKRAQQLSNRLPSTAKLVIL